MARRILPDIDIQPDLIQYGGAIFSARCGQCGELAKPPAAMSVNSFMRQHGKGEPHTIDGRCPGCGLIALPFVGFEKDLAIN